VSIPNEDYWRALILYGKNQSTYKMALGKILLQYSQANREKVSLDDLAGDFFDLYNVRMKNGKPQGATLGRRTVVEQEVLASNNGRPSSNTIEVIKKRSLLEMVLQKFHNLNNTSREVKFYNVSEDNSYLHLEKNLLDLAIIDNFHFLESEIGSRWDLLEHAFENIHHVESLDVDEYLKRIVKKEKRIDLTGLIETLEGYQNGRCFYCGEPLFDIHVDHVLPYSALRHNDIWNLVLAHSFCNEQKSDNIPPLHFVEKLIQRNEYFIASSHPLKNTIIEQLGTTVIDRSKQILKDYRYVRGAIVRIWGGNPNYDPSMDEHYKRMIGWFASEV
jgi:hypothetical protein